jgi:hypothetical protein
MEGEPRPSTVNFERLGGSPESLPDKIRLTAWQDALVEEHGFEPRSMYVECVWLPVLGPTATLLYRRLGSWAKHNEEGIDVDPNQLALSMGLGEGLGRNSKLARALGRLVRFELARAGGGELQVRTAVPPLPLRVVKALDPLTQTLHDRYMVNPHRDRNGLVT